MRADRPDLRVSAGALRQAADRLSGEVTVRNSGTRAARSTVSLSVKVNRRTRTLGQAAVPALRRGRKTTVRIRIGNAGKGLPAGRHTVTACADGARRIRERRESNNCRTVGRLTVSASAGGPSATGTPGPAPVAPGPAPAGQGPPLCATPACDPIGFTADGVTPIPDPAGRYWAYVPASYDATHRTATKLLVWLHGCGGESSGDIWNVADYWGLNYIAIAPDGAEGACWNMATGPQRVLTAIADAKRRFNIDARRVIVGGYSSGGDLSYRTAFEHARTFAGVLATNTSPFRDTGLTQAGALGMAAWKFPVLHLAHVGDLTYPIAGVRAETDAMTAAGFPMERVERPGTHYDPPPTVPNTDKNIQDLLIRPGMAKGWQSP